VIKVQFADNVLRQEHYESGTWASLTLKPWCPADPVVSCIYGRKGEGEDGGDINIS
jgi:hypothetical protein